MMFPPSNSVNRATGYQGDTREDNADCAQSPWAAGDGTGRGDEIVTCVTFAPALRSASSLTALPSSPFLKLTKRSAEWLISEPVRSWLNLGFENLSHASASAAGGRGEVPVTIIFGSPSTNLRAGGPDGVNCGTCGVQSGKETGPFTSTTAWAAAFCFASSALFSASAWSICAFVSRSIFSMSGFFAAGLFAFSIAFFIAASMSLSCAKPDVVVIRTKAAKRNNRRIMVRRLLLLRVAKKATLSNDRSYLRWHHFIPALVPARDALEHVTRKDRQIFRVEIIELDEAASAHQVIIKQLQLGVHLKRMNSL